MLEPGTPAPDFTLPDQSGRETTLSSLKGSPVVLYFYPVEGCGDDPGRLRLLRLECGEGPGDAFPVGAGEAFHEGDGPGCEERVRDPGRGGG